MSQDEELPQNIAQEQVIKDGLIEKYKQNMATFHNQLAGLNLNLTFCDRIAAFPAELFEVGPGRGNLFLLWTFFTAYRAASLQITRLITDQIADATTLPKFKNLLFETLIKDEYKNALGARLRAHKFETQKDSVLKKIRDFRDSDVAHFIPNATLIAPTLAELRDMTERVNALFNALSFDAEYRMLPLEYESDDADLDRILDAIAKNSHVLNAPERSPERWAHNRERLSVEDLAHINRYRQKFKMPPA